MERLTDRLYSWASILDPQTREQADALSRLPIIAGHVALMPDAHLGKGSTVGSVIPTSGAVIPAAVGVDIGCAIRSTRSSTNWSVSSPPDSAAGTARRSRTRSRGSATTRTRD
jgi:tRNA-splicing ligase RtcB